MDNDGLLAIIMFVGETNMSQKHADAKADLARARKLGSIEMVGYSGVPGGRVKIDCLGATYTLTANGQTSVPMRLGAAAAELAKLI